MASYSFFVSIKMLNHTKSRQVLRVFFWNRKAVQIHGQEWRRSGDKTGGFFNVMHCHVHCSGSCSGCAWIRMDSHWLDSPEVQPYSHWQCSGSGSRNHKTDINKSVLYLYWSLIKKKCFCFNVNMLCIYLMNIHFTSLCKKEKIEVRKKSNLSDDQAWIWIRIEVNAGSGFYWV